ncbi:MAG: hypothetical protein R3E95_18485 [Thiolinea sp.]
MTSLERELQRNLALVLILVMSLIWLVGSQLPRQLHLPGASPAVTTAEQPLQPALPALPEVQAPATEYARRSCLRAVLPGCSRFWPWAVCCWCC